MGCSGKFYAAPSAINDWKKISDDFLEFWNIPHCNKAIDRKHMAILKPAFSESVWHNYKGFFSMVLLTICDARYCFSFVDVGEYGSNNESGVLNNSKMGKLFKRDEMNIPNPGEIEFCDVNLNVFFFFLFVSPYDNFLKNKT